MLSTVFILLQIFLKADGEYTMMLHFEDFEVDDAIMVSHTMTIIIMMTQVMKWKLLLILNKKIGE